MAAAPDVLALATPASLTNGMTPTTFAAILFVAAPSPSSPTSSTACHTSLQQATYKDRNATERCFCRLKTNQRASASTSDAAVRHTIVDLIFRPSSQRCSLCRRWLREKLPHKPILPK